MVHLHQALHRRLLLRVDKLAIPDSRALRLEIILGAGAAVFTMRPAARLSGSRRWWIQIWWVRLRDSPEHVSCTETHNRRCSRTLHQWKSLFLSLKDDQTVQRHMGRYFVLSQSILRQREAVNPHKKMRKQAQFRHFNLFWWLLLFLFTNLITKAPKWPLISHHLHRIFAALFGFSSQLNSSFEKSSVSTAVRWI